MLVDMRWPILLKAMFLVKEIKEFFFFLSFLVRSVQFYEQTKTKHLVLIRELLT